MAIEQSYSADGVKSVEIEVRRGDITIEESADGQIGLTAHPSSSALDADLRVDPKGDVLRIIQSHADVNEERGGFTFLNDLGLGQLVGHVGRIDIHLRVPAGIRRIFLTTGLGSVQVVPWSDNLKVTTGKGDVT